MIRPSQQAVRITAPATTGPQAKVRTQFNALVKRLDAERARLAVWREEVPKIRAKANSELGPLMRAFDTHRRALIVLFDQAWHDKLMSKTDRRKLSDIIAATAEELLQGGDADPSIKELYDRHSGGDFEGDLDAERAAMLEMFTDATGLALDDDADLTSPEAILEAMRQKMEQQARADEQTARPAKPSARAVRQEAEEAKLQQSVRDIFRKLASALHPDRETDPAEHARKTALMQRANAAYAANDLLGLIELQLEVAQIDQAGLDGLTEDRIKQYNRILARQFDEVRSEIDAMETALSYQMGWDFEKRPTPKTMLQYLQIDIANAEAHVHGIAADLARFGDIRQLKAWLKTYRIPAPDDDMPWF
jgi:hypothetical protein